MRGGEILSSNKLPHLCWRGHTVQWWHLCQWHQAAASRSKWHDWQAAPATTSCLWPRSSIRSSNYHNLRKTRSDKMITNMLSLDTAAASVRTTGVPRQPNPPYMSKCKTKQKQKKEQHEKIQWCCKYETQQIILEWESDATTSVCGQAYPSSHITWVTVDQLRRKQ